MTPGTNSFLLEKSPFQKGHDMEESKQEVAKVVGLVKSDGISTMRFPSPFRFMDISQIKTLYDESFPFQKRTSPTETNI